MVHTFDSGSNSFAFEVQNLQKLYLNGALELYVLYLPKTKLMQISPFDGRMWLFVLLEMMIHTFE